MSQQRSNAVKVRGQNESADSSGKLVKGMIAADLVLVSLAMMVTVNFFTT